MVVDDKKLVIAAAALARGNSASWQQFVIALKEYARGKAHSCVMSSADEVQLSQGKAQQCAQLTSLFEDAVKTADRIEKGSKQER